jgi:signal transduction histidine kinase
MKTGYHPLLTRQLSKYFGSSEAIPLSLEPLFDRVNSAYLKADSDFQLVSHSLDEMSQELNTRNDALRRERDEQAALAKRLREAHAQLLQSEKMASIGQLAAGVAHEINNPIGYINSNLQVMDGYLTSLLEMLAVYEEYRESFPPESQEPLRQAYQRLDIEYIQADAKHLLKESREGIDRVKKIVQDLRDFSHPDEGKFVWANLHKNLDSTINIVSNEIKYRADIVRDYGNIPDIECLPSQLNQVFLNLLVNAAHAISDGQRGTITIRTGTEQDSVWIDISDTGSGISPDILPKIFDPFFTTKPVGKGTGLGLSLSYGIIQNHKGSISVSSQPNQGSTFRISIPTKHPHGDPS